MSDENGTDEGRGRGRKDRTGDDDTQSIETSRAAGREETAAPRKERVPFGVMRQSMDIDSEALRILKSDGKVPRWFNDTDMRLQRALDGGYDFVESVVKSVGGKKQDSDHRIRKQVGTGKDGKPMFAYLMAIPREYHEADQQTKEATNKMVDDAVRGGNPSGLKGHGLDESMGSTTKPKVTYAP